MQKNQGLWPSMELCCHGDFWSPSSQRSLGREQGAEGTCPTPRLAERTEGRREDIHLAHLSPAAPWLSGHLPPSEVGCPLCLPVGRPEGPSPRNHWIHTQDHPLSGFWDPTQPPHELQANPEREVTVPCIPHQT